MHESITFFIGKLNFVSFQFVFRCVPPSDPRSPLDYIMSLHTYTKGILDLGGGGWRGRAVKAKD